MCPSRSGCWKHQASTQTLRNKPHARNSPPPDREEAGLGPQGRGLTDGLLSTPVGSRGQGPQGRVRDAKAEGHFHARARPSTPT